MSCFFCDSAYHVSQFCDIYASDESRKNIVVARRRCPYCLSIYKGNHMWECRNLQKCYICFTKGHNTIYCPLRFAVPNMFSPNIDAELFPRFMDLLKLEEKHFLALTSPKHFNVLKLKPIIVTCRRIEYIEVYETILKSDLIVIEKASVDVEFCRFMDTNFEIISQKPIVFYIKELELYGPPFFSCDILMLLSEKTKTLKIVNSMFRAKLTFQEILRKAPFLENIDIHKTNVEISNLWPDELLEFNAAVNLRTVRLSVLDLNFNVENLVLLMKKNPFLKLCFDIHVSWSYQQSVAAEAARKKLSKHFSYSENESNYCIKISFVSGLFQNFYDFYTLKHV